MRLLAARDADETEGADVKTADGVPESIDHYIARFPDHVQDKLKQVRRAIKAAAPEAQEAIKYRMPTFVLGENLVHFAAFAHHIGFYPAPSAIEAFKRELAPFKSAKGSVQFLMDEPLPLALIERIVRFRVKEVRARSASKRRSR